MAKKLNNNRRTVQYLQKIYNLEGSHIWNMQHDIKDTSNGYVYHNKKFKKTAEEIGKIKVERHEKYGWTISRPTEETIDFCNRNGLETIQIGRQNASAPDAPSSPKKSSTRKYICPYCNTTFRATKDIRVLCMDCNEQFILASKQ